MNTLFLAWQDPQNRRWFPVGRLTFNGSVYHFVYTKGAEASPHFIPFGMMRHLHVTYESDQLFPLFSNRLLSKARPEYRKFLHWVNIREDEDDPLALLARTEGLRETDSLEVFPRPERTNDNEYHVHFFVHGIRHLPQEAIDRVHALKEKDRLFLMQDLQNPYDPFALALRTADPPTFVGYCPRYLAEDVHTLLEKCASEVVRINVERVNREAPLQLRVLCDITSCWPASFRPCSGEMYEPLVPDADGWDDAQANSLDRST
jgi:hypothetical protein